MIEPDEAALLAYLNNEHFEGYRDGHELDTPRPSENRSEAYRHSWEIGRAEKERRQVPPAALLRMDVQGILSREYIRRLGSDPGPWLPLSWAMETKH